MNINAQLTKIVNSNRWLSFLESTAKGLQLNLSCVLSGSDLITASKACPVCLTPYNNLTAGDVQKVIEVAKADRKEFNTEEGDTAIIVSLDEGILFVIRDCPLCAETGHLPLDNRAQIARNIIHSFYNALAEGFQGGSRAIELSTLRHINQIILSLFQGKEDAAERSFDLILSALIIILEAQGSWLELNSTSLPQFLSKGDRQAIADYLKIGHDSTSICVEVSNSGI